MTDDIARVYFGAIGTCVIEPSLSLAVKEVGNAKLITACSYIVSRLIMYRTLPLVAIS